MSDVITAQPTSKTNYAPIENAGLDTSADVEEEKKKEEEEKKQKRSSYVNPDCCCFIGENDFLFHFLCCRMISNFFIGCGHCTERCCEGCCSCVCDCSEDTDNVVSPDTSGDCCGSDCCDCDCGGCDCDCGGCDCDCFG